MVSSSVYTVGITFTLYTGAITLPVYEDGIASPLYTGAIAFLCIRAGAPSPCIHVLYTSLCIRVLLVPALWVANWFLLYGWRTAPPYESDIAFPVYTRYRPFPLNTRHQRSSCKRGGSAFPPVDPLPVSSYKPVTSFPSYRPVIAFACIHPPSLIACSLDQIHDFP